MKRLLTIAVSLLMAAGLAWAQEEDALLFYLSGDKGTTADISKGTPYPNYVSRISVIDYGAVGKGIRCDDIQLLSYRAPGNIYAKRGTVSFFWRSAREFQGVPFPIFRVGYADHTSWDMCWLRMDYNGHGWDAFVTDNNLVRLRVSTDSPAPDPDKWSHFAFSWDENSGIKLYIDGELVARRDTTLTLDAGLDQFGPHSRVISPYQVQSAYNFQRGGDIDELRIYSQALTQEQVSALSKGGAPAVAASSFPMSDKDVAKGWKHDFGFDLGTPVRLVDENTTVRKIGILQAYDIKRWFWKSNDGILETTWPGVYNRSRIEGRNDYFQLPDWDCYYDSGWSIRYNMPEEPWNYLEIAGGAYGEIGITDAADGSGSKAIAHKDHGTQRSFHKLGEPVTGKTVTFTNVEQETPIQEFNAYYVHEGAAPAGIARLSYSLSDFYDFEEPALVEVERFVAGRYEPQARRMLLALPQQGAAASRTAPSASDSELPIVHIVIPSDTRDLGINVPITLEGRAPNTASASWEFMRGGLDGILIELPAMQFAAEDASGLISFNVKVKDPIWKLRDMADFSFSVKPSEKRNLWLDLRDRILPEGKPMYITLASDCAAFNAKALAGARISLIFKPLEEAKAEHIADRLTMAVDNHAMTVEEHPRSKRLDKFNQMEADLRDLFRVDPENKIGRSYWYLNHAEQVPPEYEEPVAPAGVPEWAFTQLELLKEYRYLMSWYMDEREVENGEIGGGLSDDSDYANFYPAFHAIGLMPDRMASSDRRMLQAIYDQGMLTHGMSTIMTDDLHTYEEGVNMLTQINVIDPGNPVNAERLMESAKTYKERLFQVNDAGHLHMRSAFYSATQMAMSGVWSWLSYRAFYHTAPASILGELYCNPTAQEYILRFMDDMYEHVKVDERGRILFPQEYNFNTDEVREWGQHNYIMPPLYYCWLWTARPKYIDIVRQAGWYPSLGDKAAQVQGYRRMLRTLKINEWMYTEGSMWTDRIQYSTDLIQTARLGKPAMNRGSYFFPINPIAWKFDNDDDVTEVAISVTDADNSKFHIEFFNTKSKPVKVTLKGAQALLGDWTLTVGGKTSTVRFGRYRSIDLVIPARKEYSLDMKLTSAPTPFYGLPDLGIGKEDVKVNGSQVEVTVHNLAGVTAAPMDIALVNAKGKVVAQTKTPAVAAPLDLVPKTARVVLDIPKGCDVKSCKVVIDPQNVVEENYESNNCVSLAD